MVTGRGIYSWAGAAIAVIVTGSAYSIVSIGFADANPLNWPRIGTANAAQRQDTADRYRSFLETFDANGDGKLGPRELANFYDKVGIEFGVPLTEVGRSLGARLTLPPIPAERLEKILAEGSGN